MLSTFELSWRGAEVIKEQRLAQHRDVADAIRDQSPKRAGSLMQKLLDDSIEDVREALVPRSP
jgi:DNA-binding FadR family transcriptional regulator